MTTATDVYAYLYSALFWASLEPERYTEQHDVSQEKRDEGGRWTASGATSEQPAVDTKKRRSYNKAGENATKATNDSLAEFRKVWKVKVASRQVTSDPYTFSATAKLNFYGKDVEASGNGETREEAVTQALKAAASKIGW